MSSAPKASAITINWHPVPSGGDGWYDWTVNSDGLIGHGKAPGYLSALRRARRRIRKLQRLRAKVDVQTLIDQVEP